jgi:hypothetical protein
MTLICAMAAEYRLSTVAIGYINRTKYDLLVDESSRAVRDTVYDSRCMVNGILMS